MAFDPYDQDQVEERKIRRKAKAEPDQTDLAWVASDERGRRALRRIMEVCGLTSRSYVAGDALGTAFNEGKREIGLQLHSAITKSGDGLARAILAEPLPEYDGRNQRAD